MPSTCCSSFGFVFPCSVRCWISFDVQMVVSVSLHVCVCECGHAYGTARLWRLEDSSSVSPRLPPWFIRVWITAVHSRLADEGASAGSPVSTSIWTEGSWDDRGPLPLHHVGCRCSLTASPYWLSHLPPLHCTLFNSEKHF